MWERSRTTCGFPLSHCILAYDRWAYELETLAPGQSVELGTMTQRSELRTRWTGRRLVREPNDRGGSFERLPRGVHRLRSEQQRSALRVADDDVLRAFRRPAIHRLDQRLSAVRRFQRFIEDGPGGFGGPGPDEAAADCRATARRPEPRRRRRAVLLRFVLPVKKKPPRDCSPGTFVLPVKPKAQVTVR